jgi:hypothetical protein
VARRRVDDGHVVDADAVEGLGQQALGGRLVDLDPEQPLVVGAVDPVGRAGLRIGVDHSDGRVVGGRQCGQVHGRGGLSHPALQRSGDDDHNRSPQGRSGGW